MARPGNGVGATHVDPRLNDDRSDRVDDDDRVLVDVSDSLDERIAVQVDLKEKQMTEPVRSALACLCCSKFTAQTHSDVGPVRSLRRPRVDEHERCVLALCGGVCPDEVRVVEEPGDGRPVLPRLGLDRLERRDQVRERG